MYVLTRAGYTVAASLNPTLPAWRPIDRSTFLISHSLAIADLALAFHRAARSNAGHEVLDWEGDWQTAIRLGASLVVPDGHLVYATAACEIDAFIETDLGTESTRFFAQKISRYLELYIAAVAGGDASPPGQSCSRSQRPRVGRGSCGGRPRPCW